MLWKAVPRYSLFSKCLCDFSATTYWSQEKIKRSLTFHCSDFLIIWTPLILASIRRARLCNSHSPGRAWHKRNVGSGTYSMCKKSKRDAKMKACLGAHNSINHISVVFRESAAHGRFLLVTKMAIQSGQTSWAVNACTLIFAVTEIAKQKQTDYFRTWPPYLHLAQPIKLHKKAGLNRKKFEVETWREMKQTQQHQMTKLSQNVILWSCQSSPEFVSNSYRTQAKRS